MNEDEADPFIDRIYEMMGDALELEQQGIHIHLILHHPIGGPDEAWEILPVVDSRRPDVDQLIADVTSQAFNPERKAK